MRRWPSYVTLFVTLLFVTSAHAGPNENMKVFFHLVEEENSSPIASYDDVLVTTPELGINRVQIYASEPSQSEGFAGVEFDILFNGAELERVADIDLISWQWFGDIGFQMQGWPSPPGWMTVTWSYSTNCQTAEFILVGEITVDVHSPGLLSFGPAPHGSSVAVANCYQPDSFPRVTVDYLHVSKLGQLGFGGLEGVNPGLGAGAPTVTEAVTWSRIKLTHGSQ